MKKKKKKNSILSRATGKKDTFHLFYHIYPKYWDTSTPFLTSPKIRKRSFRQLAYVFRILLEEWQTV